jgi:hypothetical protein
MTDFDGDGWCIECGDVFHYDDCGGYNPPCACGEHCRACHEAVEGRRDPDYDDDPDDQFYREDAPVSASIDFPLEGPDV